ncbi:hypothetical protein ABZZ20_31260 [Streptomyces sp. NPDC006430]|uniref:hypothetical protein n=1 Tax=Streptomyces sp. NPDC006430 TaxID=3154299 RepID=UPI0033BBDEEB
MKQTQQTQSKTIRSEETARSCWDDFESVRGQMNHLFRQRSHRIQPAVDRGPAREHSGDAA